MKIKLLIIWTLSLITSAYASDFARIYDNEFQQAVRTYNKDDNKDDKKDDKIIKLIGVSHFGEKEFYDHINKLMKDKIVIYELFGSHYEDQEKLKKAITNLGDAYSEKYQMISQITKPYELFALKYGLISQMDALDYSKAKQHIHADIIIEELAALANQSPEDLKQWIDNLIPEVVPPRILKKYGDNKTEALREERDAHMASSPSLADNVKKDLEMSFEKKDSIGHILNRNKIIKSELQALWNDENPPREILIVYGADHLPDIEQFLLENGYELNKTEWLKIFNLND